jgi:hypothetical protein
MAADVVHDHLVNPRLLRTRGPTPRNRRRRRRPQTSDRDAICYPLRKRREGKTVARLKWETRLF